MPKTIQLRIVDALIVQFFAVHVGGAEAGTVVQVSLTSTPIFSARVIASCASLSLTVGLAFVKVPPVCSWLGGLMTVSWSIRVVAIICSSMPRPVDDGVKLKFPSLPVTWASLAATLFLTTSSWRRLAKALGPSQLDVHDDLLGAGDRILRVLV